MLVFITVPPDSIAQNRSRDSRTYRSELRQEQAEQTRSRVISAAGRLFAEYGYARTTLNKIAEAAGVSPETVQGHGPKAALLIAAIEFAAVGVAGEKNILNLEIGKRFVAIEDPGEALDYLVEELSEVHQRTAGLAPALRGGANADPELDRYRTELLVSVTGQARRVSTIFRDRGWLRDDVPFDDLVETGAIIMSVDTYIRITHYDGWSLPRYRAWCRRMFAETVFAVDQLQS
jgi:AcrR family transcriptional regulator